MEHSWKINLPYRPAARRGGRWPGLAGLLICLSLAPLPAAGEPEGRPDRPGERSEAHAETCRHYANRARFMSRTGPVDFVVALADGCAAAQLSLAGDDPAERAAARRVLDAMVRLRETVIAMNMEMVYGRNPDRFAHPEVEGWKLRSFRSVSRTGEFLIAHRMGVIRAFDQWRDMVPGFSLAFR